MKGWRLSRSAVMASWLVAASLANCQGQDTATDKATRQYAAAAALQNRDEFELAADEWSAFLASYPSDDRAAQARYYLAVCRLKTKQPEPAARALEELIAAKPPAELDRQARLYLGIAQFQLGQAGDAASFPRAAATLTALLKTSPEGDHAATALFYQAEALYAAGKRAEAIPAYEQLLKDHPQDPSTPGALYALAVAYDDLGNVAAADKAYARFLTAHADHPLAAEVMLRRGETLLTSGDARAAFKLFAGAAESPGFALADQALLRAAAALAEQREYDRATGLCLALAEKFPQSRLVGTAQVAAGRYAYQGDDLPRATSLLTSARAAEGEVADEATHWLARALLKQSKASDAAKIIEQHLPQVDDRYRPVLLLDLGDALGELPDRRREAHARYRELADKHPNHALADQGLYLAAFTALQERDFDSARDAVRDFSARYTDSPFGVDVRYVAAECELQSGKHAAAERMFAELAAAHPEHASAGLWSIRRALALYLQKKARAAVEVLSAAQPALKTPAERAEAQFVLGTCLAELDDPPAAIAALEAALAVEPAWERSDEVLLALAQALREAKESEAATQRLAELVAKFPHSALVDRATFRLAETAYEAGDYEWAAEHYARVRDEWPNSNLAPHATLGLAWSQLGLKQYASAVATVVPLADGEGDAPHTARARYLRALALHPQGEYAAAAADLRAFLSSMPAGAEAADAAYVLGLCQVALQQPAEAVQTLTALVEQQPEYAGLDKVFYELAWAHRAAGAEDRAAAVFERLWKERAGSPLSAEAAFHVGERAYAGEKFADAVVAFRAAREATKDAEIGEKAAHKLGWSLFRQSAFDDARAAFAEQRRAYADGPLAGDAAFMEAECLAKLGKHADAIVTYEQVKNPAGRDVALLALLHAGQAAALAKDWDKSLTLLDRAEKAAAEHALLPEVLCERGWALQNLGRAEDALKLYEAVTEKTEREVAARARFMAGEIWFERKDYPQAVRNFFKAAYSYGFPTWQAAAHYEAGRCFEMLGKPDQALKSYREVVTKFSASEQAPLAQQRVAALDGAAAKE